MSVNVIVDESIMPKVIIPSKGIQIIEDITDPYGVDTVEGNLAR